MTAVQLTEHAVRALLTELAAERPEVVRAGAEPNSCGPVAYAVGRWFASRGIAASCMHVYGSPEIAADAPVRVLDPDAGDVGSAHYVTVVGRWIVDGSYRQFDPAADEFIVYPVADVTEQYVCRDNFLSTSCPWDEYDEPFPLAESPDHIPARMFTYLDADRIEQLWRLRRVPDWMTLASIQRHRRSHWTSC